MKRSVRGFTLAEMIIAVTIFSLVLTVAVTFFSLAQNYNAISTAQVDTLSGSQQAVQRLVSDIQESDLSVISLSASHNAILLLSARNSSGVFKTDPLNSGKPYWQKWVCYYLAPDPNGPYSILERKESQSIFGSLPSIVAPTPPNTWLTQFQALPGNSWIAASGVQTFDIEDIDCGVSLSPLYIQVISTVKYQNKLTSYNPGYTVNFNCSKTGNWVQAQVENND